jgi:hypothetical protein
MICNGGHRKLSVKVELFNHGVLLVCAGGVDIPCHESIVYFPASHLCVLANISTGKLLGVKAILPFQASKLGLEWPPHL